MLLLTDLIKKERFNEDSCSFYNFSGGVFDQICDQGSGFTTRRPSNESLTKLCLRHEEPDPKSLFEDAARSALIGLIGATSKRVLIGLIGTRLVALYPCVETLC